MFTDKRTIFRAKLPPTEFAKKSVSYVFPPMQKLVPCRNAYYTGNTAKVVEIPLNGHAMLIALLFSGLKAAITPFPQ